MKELEILNKDLQQKITSQEMLAIIPLDKNVIYSFLCSFKDIDLNDKLACQSIDMFVNRVVLFDDHCDIYFNTNDDKSKHLKLKEQPDLESEILFESNKKEQSNPKGSDCSQMAENTGFEPADALTSTVFKTAALNHSANSPQLFCVGQKTVATVCQNETHGLY